jgi:hypothetical protein
LAEALQERVVEPQLLADLADVLAGGASPARIAAGSPGVR